MKKTLKKTLACVIALNLAVSSISVPNTAVKAEEDKAIASETVSTEGYSEPTVVEEVVSDRTADSTTVLLSNGMKQTTYYSDDIYYQDAEGEYAEYDNELKQLDSDDKKDLIKSIEVKKSEKDDYKYVNTEGDSKQYLPKELSEDTPVVMTKENYVLSFAPADDGENPKDNTDGNALSGSTGKVSLEAQEIENIYEDNNAEEKKVLANYSDKTENLDLCYESLSHGVKETIILNERPQSNVFEFCMTLQDMYAKMDEEGGGITIYSNDEDDIVGGIEAPFMNDASEENYSEDLHYELTEKSGTQEGIHKYILKLVVDESYLDSEKTVYPVSIDPSVTWRGTSDLPETYVLKSSSGTNYFSSGVKTFSVGKGSQGVFRSYMRAKALANTVDGKYIDSAILTVYENGANVSGVKINIKPAASSFACKTVTWANQPGGTSAVLASFKSKGTSGTKHEINLKTWAQNVAKGSGDGNKNYGLLLRAEDESVSSYVRFYGARTDTTSKKPTLKVVYYDGPTTATSVSAVSSANNSRSYLQSGENLKVSWAGISSYALSYVQYRIVNEAGTVVVSYSDSTKFGTAASGTKTISVSSLAEGKYKIYVRGVDKGGITGTGKAATFYIDKTAPVIMSLSLDPAYSNGQYSDEEPEISWNVKESNISSIQVSVNSGAYKTIGTENNDSGDITGLISGKVNLISVRAVDKAGNISAYSGYQYPYDCDEPIITMSISPDTNENKYDNSSDKPTLTYNISDSTLKSYTLSVNDEEQKLTASKGSIKLENVEEGENCISISAVDKADNVADEELTYYRDVTEPEKGTVKITPKTGFFNSSNSLPTVTWKGFEDDNLVEVQVSIDDGAYQTLGYEPNGEAKLQEKDFGKDGKYNIKVRAIDKAGNTSGDVSYNYYYETTDYALEDYTPIDVYAVEQLGGNTIIRFSTQSGKFNDSIKYQVYRGTTPLFVPDDNTLVKTVSSKGAVKVSGDENTTYYYKVRAVKESKAQYSAFSDEISSTTISADKISDRSGYHSLYEYASVSTPNGTGYVELSKGNFIYEQNDIVLPAPQIPINITRVYNSKTKEVSSFGYGWSDAYDMYISETADKIYYSDGTKAVYTFTKENDTYRCIENPELSLEMDDDILCKTIEKKDTDGNVISKTDLELDVYYKVTEKEGEIYRFDDCGRLILIEESNNTFVYIKYNEKNGKITEVTTGSGQKAEYSYNEEGFISKITAAKGTDSEYGYQYTYENGYLKKATFVGTKGGTIDYNYSYIDGKLSVITDAEGNVYRTEYDSNYNVISKFVYPNGEYNVYSFTENQEKSRPRTTVSKFNDNDSKLGEEEYYFSISGLLTAKTDVCGNKSEYKYDDKNNRISEAESSTYYTLVGDTVVKKTITRSEGTVYDTHGNITEQTEADGSVTEYVYDYSKGRAERVIDLPTEMTETDANGNVSSHELYQYDDQGNTVKVIDKITRTITNYTYNPDGTVKTSKETFVEDTEAKNAVVSGLEVYSEDTEYNADGDELSELSSEGTVDEEIVYTYDEIGNVMTETDKTNNITTAYEYDEFLRTIKTTETVEINGKETRKITESSYNKNGSQIKSVDEEGHITEYTYDSMNRAIETKLTVGEDEKITKTAYSYGSVSINTGKGTMTVENTTIITVTNTSDEVVGKTYTDSFGRTVRELSNGLYVDYTYDNSGRIFTTYTGGINETDVDSIAEGKLTVSTYDAHGNQTDTIINPEVTGDTFKVGENSIVTSNEYDAAGMLVKSTDANGNSICYTYDEQGRVTKVTTAGGTGNQYSYDNIVTDSEGNITSIVDTVTDALGSVSKTTTNGTEQVLSIKDETASGNIETTYEYDVNGEEVKETYHDGSYLTFAYDVYGNNIKKSAFDVKGDEKNTTEYVYDGESNLIEAVDSKNGTPYRYTFYEYDAYGRNISVAEINAAGRPSDNEIENAKLKYVYNIDDNIEKIYYPNASKDKLKGISFKYNKDKWITEIDGLLSGDEEAVIRKYEYHSDGKISGIKDFQNFLNKKTDYVERDYSYDVFDRVISMKYYKSTDKDVILEQYDYAYDKNSNITYMHEKFNYSNNVKDEDVSYTYNEMNQLVKSVKNNRLTYKTTTSSYRYDSVGNRTYESVITKDTVITDKTFDEAAYNYYSYNRLNQLTGQTEIITDGTTTKTYTNSYTYDKKGNQVEAIDGKAKTTTTYIYDVENRLTDVVITTDGKKTGEQYNEYNGSGQRMSKTDIVFEGDDEKSETTCYFYEGSVLLYTTDGNGNKTSQNIIGNQNNVIASIRYSDNTQKEYFYSKDVQGSTTNITDSTGECVQSYEYTDFGETSERITTEFENEICYTGGVYDELTGLYYLNARYYNPDGGVFLSQDTYRSGNLYGYCGGNPINFVDPSGHSAVVVSGGVYKQSKKEAGGYYYEFIETALKKLNELSSGKEKKYWLIADNGWTKKDKRKFKKQAKKSGTVKIKYFKCSRRLIKILNSSKFEKDPIADFTVFAHGFPGKISFGYNGENGTENNKLTLRARKIKKINTSSFTSYPTSFFYSCRTAAENLNGKNFAKMWKEHIGGETYAYTEYTSYTKINYIKGYSWLDMKIYEWQHGGKTPITPARRYPTGDGIVYYTQPCYSHIS